MSDPRKGEYRVPSSAPLSRCRSCHAPIIWATTGKNRPIPLSVASIRRDESGVKWAISHFADCPSAAQHRRAAQAEANAKRNTINLAISRTICAGITSSPSIRLCRTMEMAGF